MIRIQPDPNPDPKHWLKLKEILKYVEEIAKDRPSHWQLIDINPLKGEQSFPILWDIYWIQSNVCNLF